MVQSRKCGGTTYQALHELFPTAHEFSVGPNSKNAPDIFTESGLMVDGDFCVEFSGASRKNG